MLDFNSAHTAADFEAAVPAALAAVQTVDLDTLAKLNTIVADATLIDTADSRLSDARTPTAHAASHATAGGDAITPADIGAATSAQGALADTAVQPARAVNSGIGLDGGGDLSADRTLALTVAVLGSLALADTATQPGDLATVATTGEYADLLSTPTIPSALSDLSDADTTGVQDGEALLYVAANSRFEPGAVGGGSAAGADGQIQFALSGGFSADAGLAYNNTTKALTVGGATVTTDSPVLDLMQTWNAAGVTFTALKLNVTDTASAAASNLLDLQVGGASKFRVDQNGNIYVGSTIVLNTNVLFLAGAVPIGFRLSGTVAADFNTVPITWGGSGTTRGDVQLWRDSAGTLAQRNGTNPQTFLLANTHTSGSDYERLSIGWATNVCTIATEADGTGTKRNLVLDGANRAAYSETPADIAAALVAHGIMSPA